MKIKTCYLWDDNNKPKWKCIILFIIGVIALGTIYYYCMDGRLNWS